MRAHVWILIMFAACLLAAPQSPAQQRANPFGGGGAMGGQGMGRGGVGGVAGQQQPQMPLLPQQRELTSADRAVMRNFAQSDWLNATITAGARRYNLSKSGRSINYKILQGQQVIMDGKVPTENLFLEPEEPVTADDDLDMGAPTVAAGPGVTLRPLTGYRYERVSLSDGTSMIDRVAYDWQELERAKEADIAYYEMMYTMNPPTGMGGMAMGGAGLGAAGYGAAGPWQMGRAQGAAGMAAQGAQFRAGGGYPVTDPRMAPGAGYPPQGGFGGGYPAPAQGGFGGGYPAPAQGGFGGGYPAPAQGGFGGGFPAPAQGGFGGGYPAPAQGGGFPMTEAMAGGGGFGMEYSGGVGYPMEGTLAYEEVPMAAPQGEQGTPRQLAEWYYAFQQLRMWESYVQRIIGRREVGSKIPAAVQELPTRYASLHNEYLSERNEAEENEYRALMELYDNIHRRKVARDNYLLFKDEQMEYVGEQITEWSRQDRGQVLVRDGVTYVRSDEPIKQLDVESVNIVAPNFSPYHILNDDGTMKSELDAMR